MEKKKGNQIKLGVFVSLAIALFIFAIYFIGRRQKLFSSTFHVSGVFEDISGLQVGNNVRFAGINVGIIDDIEQVSDSTVRVDMQIVEGSRKFMKQNAIAVIGSDGLMGSKIVLIIPGTTGMKEISNNDVIETVRQVNLDEIMLNLKKTSDNAAQITSDLSIIMNHVREGKGAIGMLLMDSILANNLDAAIVNIRQGSGGFKQNMDAAGHNFLLRGYLKKKAKKEKEEKDKKKM